MVSTKLKTARVQSTFCPYSEMMTWCAAISDLFNNLDNGDTLRGTLTKYTTFQYIVRDTRLIRSAC